MALVLDLLCINRIKRRNMDGKEQKRLTITTVYGRDMKVRDLLEAIERNRDIYPDFMDWDIALEQHPDYEDCPNCENKMVVDGEQTGFLKSHAGCCVGVYWYKDKIFGINIHY